jgi:hypothetical protein
MKTLFTMFFSSSSSLFARVPDLPYVVLWPLMYAISFVVPGHTLLCIALVAVFSFGTKLVFVCWFNCDAVKLCCGEVMPWFSYVCWTSCAMVQSCHDVEMLWLFFHIFHG